MRSKKLELKWLMALCFLLIGCLFTSNAQEAVPFSPRLNGGSMDIRGNIIFAGNNILNRASQADPSLANTAYNGTDNNNNLWMEYIDIDGDPTTFSSSSAELNIPDPSCSQVRYAGLYWAEVPMDRLNLTEHQGLKIGSILNSRHLEEAMLI